MDKISPYLAVANETLQSANIPMILWGENAMALHGIPTMILCDDILVPDDMLDCAASALQDKGWTVSTGPLPLAHAGFWMEGWQVVADACRRFHYPPSTNAYAHELLILPSTFVGLHRSPDLNSVEYTKIADNLYCPSAHLLAKMIATVHLRHSGSHFGRLMRAWCSYFYEYIGFHHNSLDDAEPEVKKYWRELGDQCTFRA